MNRIGFDFDGVICEKIKFNGVISDYRKELINAKPLMDISNIGKIYIVTGRYLSHADITVNWLKKHYPNLIYEIHFVNQLNIKDKGYLNYQKFIKYISYRKLQAIKILNLLEYHEDNFYTVKFLRNNCFGIDIIHVDESMTNEIRTGNKFKFYKYKYKE